MATDIKASGCLTWWVAGVASEGTFVNNAAATWENTFETWTIIPEGWNVQTASE